MRFACFHSSLSFEIKIYIFIDITNMFENFKSTITDNGREY